MADRYLRVALTGNPNSGKTTIFNNLTGARQHVANYPGVTVEKKEGRCTHNGMALQVVDLPGTYSLTAYSIEEVMARHFIIEERPDVVVDIIDSSNLERNLYLATQLIELNAPLVLAFNMSDVAKARGIRFDIKNLSTLLGTPIVLTVGHRRQGMKELLDAIVAVGTGQVQRHNVAIHYGTEIERELDAIQGCLEANGALPTLFSPRWTALKLIENDRDVQAQINDPKVLEAVENSRTRIEKVFGDSPEMIIADRRYGFISGACQEAVRSTVETRHYLSDQVDAVLAHRILGLPVFLSLMYLVFFLTFTLGDPPMRRIEAFFGWLGVALSSLWPADAATGLKSLLVDGLMGGVGGVLVFLPNILLLFLAIAILEDTGYMARAAFIMDHFMHRFRLHGKSFIPLLIGFGCSVPAIMAARTLENQRDRLTTILVTPLMSCGARLPIYALIIPAFFPQGWRAPMLWLIYCIGMVIALAVARFLRVTVLRGESTPFVMELPPYRLPTVRGLVLHMWHRAWLYLKKAGTIILSVSIVLWAMTNYPKKKNYDEDYEARLRETVRTYLEDLTSLNSFLGLAPDSTILLQAIHGEENLEQIVLEPVRVLSKSGTTHIERDRIGPMSVKREERRALERFLEMSERVQGIRNRFGSPSRQDGLDIGAGNVHALALERERAHLLAQAERLDPGAYAAAMAYWDDVRAPFEASLKQIEGERAGEDLTHSVAGRIGRALEPALAPMGFDWKIGTALIGALAAKEVFVAQLGIVYSMGGDQEQEALRARLHADYSPLVAFCIMLFCLVSAPCMATVAVTRSETNSWKWAMAQWGGLTALGYVMTVVVYQVGRFFGLG